jgi:MoaA/NifB/PqqE/SkfB family radical SAM enzyme
MIDSIEIELTTHCNASCPQCSRNFYGGPKWPTLPLVSLDLEWLKAKLPLEFVKNLKLIRLCGTYGDPCVHPDLLDVIQWFKTQTQAKIIINTNGGMRKPAWWTKLARTLGPNDMVLFGIDGLDDTNHIYRKGVDYNKLMDNVKSFIGAGGQAEWQFIVFEHNQHQVEAARKISRDMGFREFFVKKTTRFVDKKHELVNKIPIIDKHKIVFLRPPTDPRYLNEGYDSFDKKFYQSVPIKCIKKSINMIYLGADGYVFPCGYLHDRLYGFEAETHPDQQRLQHLFSLCGGSDKANLNFTALNDIIYGKWFKILEESWSNENRLERCAHICHENNKLVSYIDSHIGYKDF